MSHFLLAPGVESFEKFLKKLSTNSQGMARRMACILLCCAISHGFVLSPRCTLPQPAAVAATIPHTAGARHHGASLWRSQGVQRPSFCDVAHLPRQQEVLSRSIFNTLVGFQELPPTRP
jgi:hypothetical protein